MVKHYLGRVCEVFLDELGAWLRTLRKAGHPSRVPPTERRSRTKSGGRESVLSLPDGGAGTSVFSWVPSGHTWDVSASIAARADCCNKPPVYTRCCFCFSGELKTSRAPGRPGGHWAPLKDTAPLSVGHSGTRSLALPLEAGWRAPREPESPRPSMAVTELRPLPGLRRGGCDPRPTRGQHPLFITPPGSAISLKTRVPA